MTATMKCENCDWTDDLDPSADTAISHIWERVDPGEPMPAGQCPKCGALCHLIPVYTPEEQAAIAWARDNRADDDLEIDDEPNISHGAGKENGGDEGVWVSAWVWVPAVEIEP